MNADQNKTKQWNGIVLGSILLIASFGLALRAVDSGRIAFASDAASQMTFPTPAQAATALANATRNGDLKELDGVLGSQAKTLITSGDTESDKAAMQQFYSKYQQMNRWVDMTDGTRVLYIGADNFAFPVPLAKNTAGRWYFDGVAGTQEIRARDIGRNEILAIDAVAALSNAEELYYATSTTGEYTQRIISSTGKQDGLYWPMQEDQGSSPLGHLSKFPKASLASYSPDQPFVIDGYTLRILTSQGDNAEGGAQSYIVNGKMTGGFAILASPLEYGQTGIMSFILGPEGVVYERDLGPDTTKLAAAMQTYNPDDYWSPVN